MYNETELEQLTLSPADEDIDTEYWETNSDVSNNFVSAIGAIDGANSLGEAAAVLRAYADWLEEKEIEGWRLRAPIEEDYGEVYLIDSDGCEIQNINFE